MSWGAGSYSALACSLSTILAGVLAAVIRREMFENKRPGWLFCLAIGVVMEIIHLTILFLTHLDAPSQAFTIVRACTFPMVLCNSVAVSLSSLMIELFSVGFRKQPRE